MPLRYFQLFWMIYLNTLDDKFIYSGQVWMITFDIWMVSLYNLDGTFHPNEIVYDSSSIGQKFGNTFC